MPGGALWLKLCQMAQGLADAVDVALDFKLDPHGPALSWSRGGEDRSLRHDD